MPARPRPLRCIGQSLRCINNMSRTVAPTSVAFVLVGGAGFLLSVVYRLLEGWWDQALGPAWLLLVIFAGAVYLGRRLDRWGAVGDTIALSVALSYVAFGQLTDPITPWAFGHNAGFALYICLAILSGLAVLAALGWQLWVRLRHGGRLPEPR